MDEPATLGLDGRATVEPYSSRARNYARFRPSYPPGVVRALSAEAGLRVGARVADVGAGTGLFTGLLLDAGLAVYAVEPNTMMRRECELAHGHREGFHPVAGAAEATTLGTGSVEAITCAQSFHWFDLARTVPEFRRILRPGGTVGLVWHHPLPDPGGFQGGYDGLVRSMLAEHRGLSAPVLRDRADSEPGWSPRTLSTIFGGAPVQEYVLRSEHDLTLDGLRGMVESLSFAPSPGTGAHAGLMEKVARVFGAHEADGAVRLGYETVLFCLALG